MDCREIENIGGDIGDLIVLAGILHSIISSSPRNKRKKETARRDDERMEKSIMRLYGDFMDCGAAKVDSVLRKNFKKLKKLHPDKSAGLYMTVSSPLHKNEMRVFCSTDKGVSEK